MVSTVQVFQQILHYATLPGAAGLICVIVFMLGKRRRGQLVMLSLSAAVSFCLLFKEFFKVPRPWLLHAETAPYLAEGGYALPCLHTMLSAAVFCSLALTSKHRWCRFLCAAAVCVTAAWRILTELQSVADVLTGLVCGLGIAFLLTRFYYRTLKKTARQIAMTAVLFSGLAAAVWLQDGWGLGLCLTVILTELLDKPYKKAEEQRTAFGKIYGTIFAAGIYAGLIIFLPFLVEWLITPLWPGQVLIVFLITSIPCLLRLFPIF